MALEAFDVVKDVIVAVASGAVGVASGIWWLSSKLTKLESAVSSARRDLDILSGKHDGVVEEQGHQWNELNRTLGQIQGELKARRRS